MLPRYEKLFVYLSSAVFLTAIIPETQASVIQTGIGSFFPSATIVNFTGPSSNPYTEVGTTFSGPGLSLIVSQGFLVPDGSQGPLAVSFPSPVDRFGLTSATGGNVLAITRIDLFSDSSFVDMVDTFPGPIPIAGLGVFFGVLSTNAFQSVRISTSPITYLLDDFRFQAAVPEAKTSGLMVLSFAVLIFASVARRQA
jgi:hypothetical protein